MRAIGRDRQVDRQLATELASKSKIKQDYTVKELRLLPLTEVRCIYSPVGCATKGKPSLRSSFPSNASESCSAAVTELSTCSGRGRRARLTGHDDPATCWNCDSADK